jgi:hypothetical protein
MYYTLAQAEAKLARFADGGSCDVKAAINDAVEQLSNMDLWRTMKRVVRISVQDDVLPMPQCVKTILRITVDGSPSHIFGTDYQFLQSGIGDMDWGTSNYGLGLTDYGAGHSTQFDVHPDYPGRLVAVSSDNRDQGKLLTIRAILADGTETTLTTTVKRWLGSDGTFGFDPRKVEGTSVYQVTSVVLPTGMNGYVSLYCCDDTYVRFLAKYHPGIIVPEFRRYRVNWQRDDETPSTVLAEVRMQFLPLVASTDIIPLSSVYAVQYMMQAIKEYNAGNAQGGQNYEALASRRLSEEENAQTRAQGLVVQNVLLEATAGGATGRRLWNL